SGPAVFTTYGSSFDTLLGVYTGSSVGALTKVAANDDNGFKDNLDGRTLTSSVSFNAVAGTTYYIAMDGSEGRTGDITLGWGPGASIKVTMNSGARLAVVGDDARVAEPVVNCSGIYDIRNGTCSGTLSAVYEFSHLRVGGNYALRILRGGTVYERAFYPITSAVNEVTLNFDNTQSSNSSFPDGCPYCTITASGTVSSSDPTLTLRDGAGNTLVGKVLMTLKKADGTFVRAERTDEFGKYILPNLIIGDSYVITPSKEGFIFSPPSISFTAQSNQPDFNFTIQEAPIISGQARRSDNSPLEGATVTLTGGSQPVTTQTDSGGYYKFYVLQGGTYSVSASKQGVIFEQPSRTVASLPEKAGDFKEAATYNVTGRVKNVNGAGIAGVKVELTGPYTQAPQTTNSNGDYTFANVPSANGYTLKPSFTTPRGAVVNFFPFDQTFNLTANKTADDFQAGTPTYSISGFVKDTSGKAVAGATVTLSGGASKVLTTQSDGSYITPSLAILGNYTLTPSMTPPANTTATFTPAKLDFNALDTCGGGASCSGNDYLGANFTVQLTTIPPTVQFSQANYSVGEGSVAADITVTRTGDTTQPVTVSYATKDPAYSPCKVTNGAAAQNCDYLTTSGTLLFPANETSKTFQVIVIDDQYVEGPETVQLTLGNVVGGSLGSQATAALTITDNDNTAPTTNASDGAQYFVLQHYYDFLSRVPKTDEL
ncbi:MAG TPA: carboxypeptidase regulatory-like domain-containing protein, partial [Pyrinomonadaceae bacterium]